MKVSTLQKDTTLQSVPSGNTIFARNVVYTEKYGSVSNEDGFTELYSHPKKFAGGYSTNKEEVLFSGEGATSEIGVFKNGTYTKILQSSILGFDKNTPIELIGFYNSKGELTVIWWDGNYTTSHKPRILNLDCLPFEVDVNKVPLNANDLIVLDLHQDNPSANLDIEIRDSGNIEAGAYYPVFAYRLSDGSYTNFSHPHHPIYINDDNAKTPFEENDGVLGGTIVNKSILLKFNGLITVYKNIVVALIKKTNGQLSAIKVGESPVNSSGESNIVFSDINSTSNINLESILIDSPIYTRAQAGAIIENQLNLLNLSLQGKPPLQQYVNNINVEWVLEDGDNLMDFNNSNKDSEYTFFNKSFKSGETYALYLVAKINDLGLVAYHIPAKGETGNSRNITINGTSFGPSISLQNVQSTIGGPGSNINVDEGLMVNSEAKVFHIFNTAQSDGKMGVFINKDEKYPATDCWLIYDSNGLQIGSYQNRPVTHHTFPSWQRLIDFNINNNLYKINDVSKLTLIASSIYESDDGDNFNNPSYGSSDVFFPSVQTSLTGTWSQNGTRFTANEDMSIYLRVTLSLAVGSDLQPNIRVKINKILDDNITNVIKEIYNHEYIGDEHPMDDLHFEVKIFKGEQLDFRFTSTSGTNIDGRIEILFINKNFNDSNITSKKLGVKLSNFNIPSEFLSQIEWWTLGFAERKNIDITRSGQAILIPDTRNYIFDIDANKVTDWLTIYDPQPTNLYRTHNFDHLFFKSNSNVDFISGNLIVGTEDVYDFHNLITSYIDSQVLIKSVKESEFIPENNKYKDNNLGEEHLRLLLNNTTDFGIGKRLFVQADLCHFKENVYLNFNEQIIIVSDQKFQKVETESNPIYNGDTFLTLSGFSTYYTGDRGAKNITSLPNFNLSNKMLDDFLYVVESITNVGFRYRDINDNTRYYPLNISLQTDSRYLQTDEEKELWVVPHLSQGLLYNTDFNSINNIKEIQIFKCLEGCESEITRFPVRIARSPKISNESVYNSWRRFRPNDYYDGLPKDRGEGWVLTTFNRSLLIQLQEALYVALPKDIIQSDAVYAYLGSGDLFDRMPEEVVPDGNGYVGCVSKWSTGVCKHGYFVIDSVQGKVFIFDGKISEISNEGLREYLRFLAIPNEQDNPLNNRGCLAGFDELYNRLIITKIYRKNNVIDLTSSQTLSYSFDLKGWVCTHHDYIPSIYLYARNKFLSIDNNTLANSFKLYKHNIDGKVCVYYNNTRYPGYFDVVFNNGKDVNWQSIQWLSDFFTASGVTFENTISHIMVYTNHHTTGLISLSKLINLFKNSDNTRKKNYTWSFNKLRDVIINKNVNPVDSNGVVNTGNINNNLPFYQKNHIINPFIVVRFYMDTAITNKIHINEVFAQFTEYET